MAKIGDAVPAEFVIAHTPASETELMGLLALNGKVKTLVSHGMAIPAPDPTSNRSKGGRRKNRAKKTEAQ